MSIGVAYAVSLVGVEGHVVRIEAAMLRGLPSFTIVGLPDTAVSESRERIRAAFASAGIAFPAARVTVNLSPADTPKSGTGFDAGIAAAILWAMGGSGEHSGGEEALIGELGLDGSIRAVKGILPAAIACARRGMPLRVPHGTGKEAAVGQVDVTEMWHVSQLAVRAGVECAPIPGEPAPVSAAERPVREVPDLADIRGQEEARFAVEVAAAGGHHLLMTGSPGVGKSMLAKRLPGILPPLTTDHAVEVAAIASACGEFDGFLSHLPPLASPHHNVSVSALVGGGSWPRPGAVSRAHRGVLFMDELPEFPTNVLQALRQPLEDGKVEIHRAKTSMIFPARFQLIGAANPCRCGRYLDSPTACTCSVKDRREYVRRIGGPIFDRFDLNIVLRRMSQFDLATEAQGESSANVACRVHEARQRQRHRYADHPWDTNALAPGAWLRHHVIPPELTAKELNRVLSHGELSMRGADKIVRLALTLADISGVDHPRDREFHQAFAYRLRGGFYGAE